MASQRLVWRFNSFPIVTVQHRPPSAPTQFSTIDKGMAFSLRSTAAAADNSRKLPILLFDIMDTIVRDPFYHDVPAFFGYSLTLLPAPHISLGIHLLIVKIRISYFQGHLNAFNIHYLLENMVSAQRAKNRLFI